MTLNEWETACKKQNNNNNNQKQIASTVIHWIFEQSTGTK